MSSECLSDFIKATAQSLGFGGCGIAHAEPVQGVTSERFPSWLAEGKQAGMGYMANFTDIRLDPRLLLDGAQSIVCVALNYFPQTTLQDGQYKFAWYAYGGDYHDVMRSKLFALLAAIKEQCPEANGRVCCDSAPMLERYWAWKSGLGWIGKNTQLIIPAAGSTFFLGELILDIPLTYDEPIQNRCGRCTQCIDACPTHALESPYHLDASKCLSYLTIENKGEIPDEAAQAMGDCIYGCDRCQQACPWNRRAQPTTDPSLQPKPEFLEMHPEAWDNLTVEQYRVLFKGSSVKRAKYEGLMRNIRAIKKRSDAL